jgi:hypothetical protein
MPEVYLFDIPYYWREEDRFNREYERDLTNHLCAFEKQTGYPLTDNLRLSLTGDFWRRYIAPWRFNQVVGWVRLYKLGSQLRGESWFMNVKHSGRQVSKKQFSLHGKAFELHIWPDQTSKEIFEAIVENLRRFQKSSSRRIFLDLECLENLGSFIDWRRVMDSRIGA